MSGFGLSHFLTFKRNRHRGEKLTGDGWTH